MSIVLPTLEIRGVNDNLWSNLSSSIVFGRSSCTAGSYLISAGSYTVKKADIGTQVILTS